MIRHAVNPSMGARVLRPAAHGLPMFYPVTLNEAMLLLEL